MTRRAFLCGVNTHGLRYAERDAALLAACLQRHGYVVTQATNFNDDLDIIRSLRTSLRECAPTDTFLFYFSGHGRLEAGELGLLISDAQLLPFPTVQSELQRCPAHDLLVILDCCHAGAAPVTWDFTHYQSERYRLLTASQRLERTRECDDLQASFMTYHIHRLLTELPADLLATDQQTLSLNRLYDSLKNAAQQHNRDHPDRPVPIPNLLGNAKHDLVLAVVTDPQARPFPPTLGLYLADMIARFSRLRLPDGREVALERIYVSLTADQLNAAERHAEQELLRRDAEQLFQQMQRMTAEPNRYDLYVAFVQAIKYHPVMRLLQARDWEQRFSTAAPERYSLAEVVQSHHAVVLLGDPGAGKTTLGRWLVLQYARAMQAGAERVCVPADRVRPTADTQLIDLDRVRLPIFVRIADYAAARWGTPTTPPTPDLTLIRFIENGLFLQPNDLPPGLTRSAVGQLAQQALQRGQALVVLDGLDEVGNLENRRTVMDAIRAALEAWRVDDPHAANRVLLTSRVVGYQFEPLTDRPHYTVAAMDKAAIRAFCQAWVAHAWDQHPPAATPSERDAAIHAENLVNAVLQHAAPSVRTLAGNPLLLTILAQLYWNNSTRSLPTRRADLFAEAAQALYNQRSDHWDRVKLTNIRLFRALAAVAYHLHAHEPIGFTDEGTVRDRLHDVLGDKEQVEAVLSAARDFSGFLVERGSQLYGFLHRALQEFFVAHYLVDEDVSVDERKERLRRHLLDPTWREPLLLAVGRVASTRTPCYRGGKTFLPQVFAVLLETPDPAGAILPRRELLAAAACAECATLPPGVVRNLATRLLHFAMRRNEQAIPAVLFERIQDAFDSLRACPDANAAYAVLRDAIEHPEFEQRLAALDLLTGLAWYQPDELLPVLLCA